MGRTFNDRVMVSDYLDRAQKLALETLSAAWGLSRAEAHRRVLSLGLEVLGADPTRFRVPGIVDGPKNEIEQ